jgi:hypothetical protein
LYRRSEAGPVFVEVAASTDEALQAVLRKIITRTMKLLSRRGALVCSPFRIDGRRAAWRTVPE